VCGRPFFPVRAVGRDGVRPPQFGQAAFDGAAVAAEDRGNAGDAAVTEFEGSGGGVKPSRPFAEMGVGEAHRRGDGFRERESHVASSRGSGILAKRPQTTGQAACRKDQMRQLINSAS
jgi:hypothetical protein